ncbi:MAG TPA: ZIP family metal transporter, partial [bacterium]|nr:ZIP family metal transporter [bacterium]
MPEHVPHLTALQYAALVVATSFLAGLLPLAMPRPERCAHLLVGFAAGAVLGLAFWHMLPEAVEAFKGTPLPAAAVLGLAAMGAGALYFIEHVLLPHDHHHLHQLHDQPDGHSFGHLAAGHHPGEGHVHGPECAPLESSDLCEVCDISFYGVASFIGLSFHSFVDGLYLSLDGVIAAPWIIFLG